MDDLKFNLKFGGSMEKDIKSYKKKIECECCGKINFQGPAYKNKHHKYCKKCRKMFGIKI